MMAGIKIDIVVITKIIPSDNIDKNDNCVVGVITEIYDTKYHNWLNRSPNIYTSDENRIIGI
jgi:hypothetical protein